MAMVVVLGYDGGMFMCVLKRAPLMRRWSLVVSAGDVWPVLSE